MTGEQTRLTGKCFEGEYQRGVAFLDGPKETVVRRSLLGFFPCTFDRIEIWRVRRQSEQFDSVSMFAEPFNALRIKVMTRAIINDEKDFPATGLRLSQARLRPPSNQTL